MELQESGSPQNYDETEYNQSSSSEEPARKRRRRRRPRIKAATAIGMSATNNDIEIEEKPMPRKIRIALVRINRDAFLRFRIGRISHHQTLLPYLLEFNGMDFGWLFKINRKSRVFVVRYYKRLKALQAKLNIPDSLKVLPKKKRKDVPYR
jgi:hypothetical protein